MDDATDPPPNEEGPKLEDFLGSCYTNSLPSNEDRAYCQPQPGEINVNIPPHYNATSEMETERGEYMRLIHPSYPVSYYSQDMISSSSQLSSHCHPNPNNNGMYHIPFDGATSVSGFKSWLRQTPFLADNNKYSAEESNQNSSNFQALSLGMNPSAPQPGTSSVDSLLLLQVADDSNKKRNLVVNKSTAKESTAPRKSIDTFGQRTSQYRGVTRY